MMDVYEAVTSRRAVRAFKDEPVSTDLLERVLSAAAWAPSGSNIQPWNTYVLTGAPRVELKTTAVERVAHGDPWDDRQYEMYPPVLKSPYAERLPCLHHKGSLSAAERCLEGAWNQGSRYPLPSACWMSLVLAISDPRRNSIGRPANLYGKGSDPQDPTKRRLLLVASRCARSCLTVASNYAPHFTGPDKLTFAPTPDFLVDRRRRSIEALVRLPSRARADA